jgi:L-arabinose transport system permease protein
MTREPGDVLLNYASRGLKPRALLKSLWENTGMLLVFGALFGGCAIFVPYFLTWVNMKGLLLSVATVGIIACTMLFCLAAGDFDLSVGSVVAMSGVVAAVVVNDPRGTAALGIMAGILAGGVVGLVNGFVIARVGINALITTLATMQIVRGLSFIVSDGKAIGVRQTAFFVLGNSSLKDVPRLAWLEHVPYLGRWLLDIPTPVWIMAICFVAFGILLNKTTFGRNTLAIGGNREAARLAGIAVTRTKIIIFTLQGLAAGLAGVTLASRMTSGQPNTAQGLELQVISACVLGGVSLTGGLGTMTGVIVGVLIMGTVQNAMNLKNVPPFYQYVASGAILLAAVLLDRLKQRRAG